MVTCRPRGKQLQHILAHRIARMACVAEGQPPKPSPRPAIAENRSGAEGFWASCRPDQSLWVCAWGARSCLVGFRASRWRPMGPQMRPLMCDR